MFLDRDGVVNRAIIKRGRPYAPATIKEFDYLPKAGQAIKTLRSVGFRVFVVTNQPDVGAGKQEKKSVQAMHRRMRKDFQLDGVYVCYHTQRENCACRKPKPGMILDAAKKWDLDLKKSFMVGDRWRDIEAGRAAQCKTVWIKSDYREKKVTKPDFTADSLWGAVDWICRN